MKLDGKVAVVTGSGNGIAEVDVRLSNAGVAGPRQPRDLQDDNLWDLMWRLHVRSHLNAAREVLLQSLD